MLTKQKKLSKKEIKEDKLVEFYYKSQSFFEENKNRVYIYGGVLIAIVAAIYFYSTFRSSQNEKAGEYLAKSISVYDMGAYLEAIEGKQGTNEWGLKKIVSEYGSTENGEIAKIYLANSYANLGKIDEAFKYYEDYSGKIESFKAAALAGQAGYYASKNQFVKAAEYYLNASKVSKENVLNPEYIYLAAVNFFDGGEKEQAKNLFQQIKDDYKTSTVYSQVDRYLNQLN